MNLNVQNWKPFRIGSLFHVLRGHDLELVNCEESYDDNSVAFVSRSAYNNGVTARIQRIEGIEPLAAGLISVAGSGSSTLSTFVQPEPFYTGFHMFALESKEIVSFEAKMFITRIIETNKYKYCYGRQADKTIPLLEIKLPICCDNNEPILDSKCSYSDEGYIPDWQFMEDYIKSLHYKPLTTSNKDKESGTLGTNKWEYFDIPKLFNVCAGNYYSSEDYEDGDVPYISASNENNGVGRKTNLACDFTGNKITIGKVGATAFYQSGSFCATSDVNVLTPKFPMNQYIGLFIVSILNFSENYKWSYGRQCRIGDTKEIKIKLPVKMNNVGNPYVDEKCRYSDNGYIPDWEFMENYIKKLPYGDRI